jgi:hypothetical protein
LPTDEDDELGHAGPSSIGSLEQMNSARRGWRQAGHCEEPSLAWTGQIDRGRQERGGGAGEPVSRLGERGEE